MGADLPDPPPGEEWTLGARWIVPVDGPVLPHGTITLRGGRILAVDARGSRRPDLDLGNVAILPGLVNVHTHLDLSDAAGKCPPGPDFPRWLRRVGQHRRGQSDDEVRRAIQSGLDQCLRHGTTLLGDISVRGLSWDQVSAAPLRSVIFQEMIGLPEDRARRGVELTDEWLSEHPALEHCRPGYSLHAPYSVRKTVFEELGAGVRAGRHYPIAIHLAESRAELELLASRSGPFVPFLEALGAWDPLGLVDDLEAILKNQSARTLFIHGNHLPSPVSITEGTLVYCPRTHAAFGHEAHPFRDFMKRGTRVVLATDSLASNPDLDVLAEARHVHRHHPDIPSEAILRMITLSGAEALGWADETGSLNEGKSADLVILPLGAADGDPCRLVLEADYPVAGTMFRGQWRRQTHGWRTFGRPRGGAGQTCP